MRTTLNIDDDLYRQVKSTAALRGCSVTSLVEESLRRTLLVAEVESAVKPIRVLAERGGVLPGVDVSDSRALRERMDAEAGLDALR